MSESAVAAVSAGPNVHPGAAPEVVLAMLRDGAREAVDFGVEHIDPKAFTAAVEAVSKARRVLCLGAGTSAPLAHEVAYQLLCVGIEADSPADPHVQQLCATLLEPRDVALVVSHTRSTRETIGAAQAASGAGATLVAVTSFPRSPLADAADVKLVAATCETSYLAEALASRIAHIVVLEALCVAVALKAGDPALGPASRARTAVTQPGRALSGGLPGR